MYLSCTGILAVSGFLTRDYIYDISSPIDVNIFPEYDDPSRSEFLVGSRNPGQHIPFLSDAFRHVVGLTRTRYRTGRNVRHDCRRNCT
jgi:hypothetical protein